MSWDMEPPKTEEISKVQAAASSGGWDSEAPSEAEIGLLNKAPQDTGPKEKKMVSAVRNIAQGATGNFSDEIAGVVEAAGKAAGLEGLGVGDIRNLSLSNDGPTLDWEILKEAYKRARDKERGDLKKDAKDNPAISTTAYLAGAIGSPINKIAKGMSLAKGGATIGAISGLGGSDNEDLAGMTIDTLTGAAIGGGLGKVADKSAPILKKVTEKVSTTSKDLAEKFAARAIGAERGTIKSLGQDKVLQAGRYALDNKLLSSGVDDMIEKNDAVRKAAGELMDDAYSAIDKAGKSTFNPLEVAAKVDDKLGGFYRSPINKGEANQLENTLESILMRGEKNLPVKEAQVLKEELAKVANWKNTLNPTDKEKMAREAYGIVSQSIDEAVDKGAKELGSPNILNKLKKGRELYSSAKSAEKLLQNKQAREQGNKIIGLTDAITGAGSLGYGGATGDWTTAAGIMATKKGLERYGAQTAAKGFDKIYKYFAKSPQLTSVVKNNPSIFQVIATSLDLSPKKIPKTAEKGSPAQDAAGESVADIKGEKKWAVDGYAKLLEHDKSGSLKDPALVEKIFSSPRGRMELVAASNLEPGSRAMDRAFENLAKKFGGAQ